MAKRSTKSRLSSSASALRKLLSPSSTKDLSEACEATQEVNPATSVSDFYFALEDAKAKYALAQAQTQAEPRRSSCKSDRRRSSGIRRSFVERRRSSGRSNASSSANAATAVKVSKLMILINGAMWDSLRKYLTTEEGALNAAEEMTLNEFCEPGGYENDGCIAMHLVVRAHPPLDIVASLMRFNPCLTAQVDAYGRTPLHVAAASGASPQVVRFLLQQDVSAAAKLDYEGKTPLHLCCEKCCTEGTCDPGLGNGQLVKGPTFEVLKMLVKAFPDSLNREDQMEMSPLEHAIVNGADVKVVKLLQKLSVIEWRKVAKEDPDFYSPDLNFDTVPDDSPPLSGTCHVPPSITKSMSDTSSLSEASLVLPAIVETRLSKKVQASSQPLPNTYDSYFQTSDKSGKSWPTFTEASLLKAVLKASSDNDDAPSVTSYCTKLSTSVGGRVTAHRRSRPVRRRSACNAAA